MFFFNRLCHFRFFFFCFGGCLVATTVREYLANHDLLADSRPKSRHFTSNSLGVFFYLLVS
ncbi:hypothetical protein E0F65_05835 [Pasteurella multocida]|nr:hypothetical protein E0F65_05835 [Pasteurella multocida]